LPDPCGGSGGLRAATRKSAADIFITKPSMEGRNNRSRTSARACMATRRFSDKHMQQVSGRFAEKLTGIAQKTIRQLLIARLSDRSETMINTRIMADWRISRGMKEASATFNPTD